MTLSKSWRSPRIIDRWSRSASTTRSRLPVRPLTRSIRIRTDDVFADSLVNKLNLQNPEMQLRKVVNHPYLFYWPKDSYGNELLDEELMNASGKLLLLSQILDRLLAEGHKVLIFSNFARMLDIVHDWLNIVKQMEVYRIDGSTKEFERGPQVSDFNDPDSGESPSSRASWMGGTDATV